jgi:hypothetical protein
VSARLGALLLLSLLAAGCGGAGSGPPAAVSALHPPPALVSVFPVPGSRVASPGAEIAFRGVPARRLGTVSVSGSRSGRHGGRIAADSDGEGASFLPSRPFIPGEVVTVSTHLQVRGARGGRFRFTVATPAGAIPFSPPPPAARVPGDVLSFRSRPDLSPASVEVTRQSGPAVSGDIFLAPQQGPLQGGPMIVGPRGELVWFKALPPGELAGDFRVQTYRGRAVLTWWQGRMGAGVGVGEDVIDDAAYRQLAVVHAADGLAADLHEFQLTPRGTALITAYYPVYWSLSSGHGPARAIVLDSVVQEIDVATGRLLFEWDSLDHVPLHDSYQPRPTTPGQPFDYFHVNSVQAADDGDLIISARNTWAAYEIDRHTGAVIWTLGGRHSDFKLGPGVRFAFQHDVRVAAGAATVSVFDDGAGPPAVHGESRALTLRLSPGAAALVGEVRHWPALLADWEGNSQPLPGGERFLGWGQQPYFSQFDGRGRMVFDGRFIGANSTYRAYRFPWSGHPASSPAIGAGNGSVAVSWNGATDVAWWRVLAAGRPRETVPKQGFETVIGVPPGRIAVEALDRHGRVLGSSRTVSVGVG